MEEGLFFRESARAGLYFENKTYYTFVCTLYAVVSITEQKG